MSSDDYGMADRGYGVYNRSQALDVMDDLPETAQTLMQELYWGDSHQNEYDLERHTDLATEDITDAITILEDHGLVRSRPDFASEDNRVYWLNIEGDVL